MSSAIARDRLGGVELAYIGVHEIFQMAIAAEELGVLAGLQCSIFDAPGKWGHLFSRFTYLPSAFPLGSGALPPEKVHELPLPKIAQQVMGKVFKRQRIDPLPYLEAFECQAARRLRRTGACIAVAAETCALEYFRTGKELGMRCLLDSHGIPAPFLDAALQRAAEEFGLPVPAPCDSPAMSVHKAGEREIADVILFCSELQCGHWVKLGVPEQKCRVVPLWVDTEFWKPDVNLDMADKPLRVAAVGCGTLAKGLPYLAQAAAQLGGGISWTLVGQVDSSIQSLLTQFSNQPLRLPYMSRPQLRDLLNSHDVLVMPSLGDSFGLVAMEAMSCGLPVIVTDHCGVPVPDPDWRVPAFSGSAIAARLQYYLDQPMRIREDGSRSRFFASQFTPMRFRAHVKAIYEELLDLPPRMDAS